MGSDQQIVRSNRGPADSESGPDPGVDVVQRRFEGQHNDAADLSLTAAVSCGESRFAAPNRSSVATTMPVTTLELPAVSM